MAFDPGLTFRNDGQHVPNSVVMFISYGVTPAVHDIYHSILHFDLLTIVLVLYLTLIFTCIGSGFSCNLLNHSLLLTSYGFVDGFA